MTNSEVLGCVFSSIERELMETSAQRIAASCGVKLKLTRALHEGNEFFRLAMDDPNLRIDDKEVLIIVSAKTSAGQPFYWLVDHERRSIGTNEAFHSFAEAVKAAEIFAVLVIRTCKDLAEEQIGLKTGAEWGEDTSAKRSTQPSGAQFNSKVLTGKELEMLKQFSTVIARFAGGRGIVNFQESPLGIFSTMIGYVDSIGREFPLGFLFASNTPQGGYECSVKCIDGAQGPWAESFPDIRAALYASRKYFEFMATEVSRTNRPTLLARIKWVLGLNPGL